MQGEKPATVQPLFGLELASSSASVASNGPEAAAVEGTSLKLQRQLARKNALAAREGPTASRDGSHSLSAAGSAQGGELRTTGRPLRRIEQRLTVVSPQPTQTYVLPTSMPAKHDYGLYVGFVLCVLLPIIAASVYYGHFASNQYVTEFRFAVQDTNASSTAASAGGLLALSGGAPGAASNTNYLVVDFLTTREAVDELQKRINIISLYSKPEIDWWDRFDASKPVEKFVVYWQKIVAANYDPITGIATATIRAFSAQDALLIGSTMVTLSEELVNRIANRSAIDAVRFAQQEVDKAQQRLRDNRAKMREYRNRVGVIDPTASVSASNSSLVQTQRANLAQLETQLDSLTRQSLQPNAPAIVNLKNQIKATKEQLSRTEADVGKGLNGSALSAVVGEYEQINLEQQFAQTMVTSTMQALDAARANAAAQHLYITPYVRPSLPQSSTYPQRLWSVGTVGFFGFVFWICGVLIIRSIRERFA